MKVYVTVIICVLLATGIVACINLMVDVYNDAKGIKAEIQALNAEVEFLQVELDAVKLIDAETIKTLQRQATRLNESLKLQQELNQKLKNQLKLLDLQK